MTPSAIGSVGGANVGRRDLFVSVGLVAIVAVMILPLPPLLIDLGLSLSVLIGLLTFLVSIYLRDALDLSVFPSLILVATLLRLALNIATTRLILLRGSEGPNAAGEVIRAFGQFVVGGNYAVGTILFLILIVINFVVITKGAGRVAEVAARFALDAMPGKQMAIDADLSSGLINERDARERRRRVQEEASFHGAMDGASKFVRGDAIAGLLITAINLFAGIALGMIQHGMPLPEAAETFAIMTIGDGLVGQIPALLMSTAAGIVVTRASSQVDLGSALLDQLTRQRRPLGLAAAFLAALGLLPGMPHLVFLALALAAGAAAYLAPPSGSADDGVERTDASAPAAQPSEHELMAQLLPIELLELEIGYELVGLVDGTRDGNLLNRIAGIRRQFATDLGLIVPAIHVRDNLRLAPGEYQLLLSGNAIGKGSVRSRHYLAISPGQVAGDIEGEAVVEAAFGLPARWISAGNRAAAETLGYAVVDAASVIATHISELLRKNAHELLGRREAQELIDIFGKSNPSVIDELVPNLLPLGDVIKVLRNLLREGVSIRDLRSIFEALADHSHRVKEPDVLSELVRQRLAKHLTARVAGEGGRVGALVLDPQTEHDLRQAIRGHSGEPATFDGHAIPRVLGALERTLGRVQGLTSLPVLLVSAELRPHMAAFCQRHVPGLIVYSYREITANTPIHTLGVVGSTE
jgi:flagellar biosynthesis protein FlhA